jgi:chromosome segregation ATPase
MYFTRSECASNEDTGDDEDDVEQLKRDLYELKRKYAQLQAKYAVERAQCKSLKKKLQECAARHGELNDDEEA